MHFALAQGLSNWCCTAFGSIQVRRDTKESSLRFSSPSVILGFRWDSPCCSLTLLTTTCQHRSTAHFQPQSGSGASCTESCWNTRFHWTGIVQGLTVSGDDEVLSDFSFEKFHYNDRISGWVSCFSSQHWHQHKPQPQSLAIQNITIAKNSNLNRYLWFQKFQFLFENINNF